MPIVLDLHTIVIDKESERNPALFYNVIRGKWVNEFQIGCGCTSRKEAEKFLENLDVSGAYILKGSTTID